MGPEKNKVSSMIYEDVTIRTGRLTRCGWLLDQPVLVFDLTTVLLPLLLLALPPTPEVRAFCMKHWVIQNNTFKMKSDTSPILFPKPHKTP